MLLIKIKKTKKRFRAYPTHQAVQTTGPTAPRPISFMRLNLPARPEAGSVRQGKRPVVGWIETDIKPFVHFAFFFGAEN